MPHYEKVTQPSLNVYLKILKLNINSADNKWGSNNPFSTAHCICQLKFSFVKDMSTGCIVWNIMYGCIKAITNKLMISRKMNQQIVTSSTGKSFFKPFCLQIPTLQIKMVIQFSYLHPSVIIHLIHK